MLKEDLIAQGLKMMADAEKGVNTTDTEGAAENSSPDASPTKTEKPTEETPAVAKVICPCCKHPTLSTPIEVEGALLDHYLSCIMTGVPFSHTYPIYKGRLSVTIAQLSSAEAATMQNALSVLDYCSHMLGDSHKELLDDLTGLVKLYVGVSSISMKQATGTKLITPRDIVLMVCGSLSDMKTDLLMGNTQPEAALEELVKYNLKLRDTSLMSAVPSRLLADLLKAHNNLYAILMEAAFDTNFWEGIELA